MEQLSPQASQTFTIDPKSLTPQVLNTKEHGLRDPRVEVVQRSQKARKEILTSSGKTTILAAVVFGAIGFVGVRKLGARKLAYAVSVLGFVSPPVYLYRRVKAAERKAVWAITESEKNDLRTWLTAYSAVANDQTTFETFFTDKSGEVERARGKLPEDAKSWCEDFKTMVSLLDELKRSHHELIGSGYHGTQRQVAEVILVRLVQDVHGFATNLLLTRPQSPPKEGEELLQVDFTDDGFSTSNERIATATKVRFAELVNLAAGKQAEATSIASKNIHTLKELPMNELVQANIRWVSDSDGSELPDGSDSD